MYIKSLFVVIIASLFVVACETDKEPNNGVTISLNKQELVLEIGSSERLTATFTPFDTHNQAHKWTSSDSSIAAVDETGNVTGIGVGQATISAKALDGGNVAKCNVTVIEEIIPVKGITFDNSNYQMFEGDQLTLQYTIKPNDATDKSVEFTSSDKEVVIVDNNGCVTAVGAGKADITVRTIDSNKSASCKIEVLSRELNISEPEVSDIKSTSAKITGDITTSGLSITERGICWSTSMNPTVDNQFAKMSGTEIFHIVRDLTPSTTYYVRLYAVVNGVTKYGNQTEFETLNTVDFEDPVVDQITAHTANIIGQIYGNGSRLDEYGIVYSTNYEPTIDDNRVPIPDTDISYTIFELEVNTTYYVRLYAIIGGQTYYSKEIEFITNEELITNFKVTEYYEDKLVLESDAPRGYKSVDICYGTNPNPTITDSITQAYVSDGKLKVTLKDLSSGTTYYIRAYKIIGGKVEYFDNEFSAETLGGTYYLKILKRSDVLSCYDYYFLLQCILPEGTYKLIPKIQSPLNDSSGYARVKKEGETYQSSIYIDHNTSSFILYLYNGTTTIYGDYYSASVNLCCTNIETNVKYTFYIKSYSRGSGDWGIIDYK